MKIATVDIECTDFAAVGPGMLLCAVVKPLHEECRSMKYTDSHCKIGHEIDFVRATVNEIGKYDMIIGYNSEAFDFRWLMSRCVALDVEPRLEPLSYDLYKAVCRLGIKTEPGFKGHPRKSLGFVSDFFNLQNDKSAIYPRAWWKAVWESGEQRGKALAEIESHCLRDVEMTERLYEKILPLDKRAVIRRWRI